MTGSSIESIMSSDDEVMVINNNTKSDSGPPLLITHYGESDSTPMATTPIAATPQSDEELAKKLAAEQA